MKKNVSGVFFSATSDVSFCSGNLVLGKPNLLSNVSILDAAIGVEIDVDRKVWVTIPIFTRGSEDLLHFFSNVSIIIKGLIIITIVSDVSYNENKLKRV